MTLHDTLEALWRSPTVRAMDHDGHLQAQLRRKRDALAPVFVVAPTRRLERRAHPGAAK